MMKVTTLLQPIIIGVNKEINITTAQFRNTAIPSPAGGNISAKYNHRIGPMENSKNAVNKRTITIYRVVFSLIATNRANKPKAIPIENCPKIINSFHPNILSKKVEERAVSILTVPKMMVPVQAAFSPSIPTPSPLNKSLE